MAEPAKKMLKTDIVTASNDDIETYEEVLHEHQEALDNIELIQSQIEALNERGADEILQIEIKYNKIREPYYSKRTKIIEKIPQFWLTVVSYCFTHCKLFVSNFDVKVYQDQNNPLGTSGAAVACDPFTVILTRK